MTLKFIVAASLLWGTVGGFVALADRRAKYWKPIIEGIASRAETGPVTSLRVLPFKGCGWSIGETIYADMMLGNVRGAFLMCRNSQGVRVDITTYESRWMRGPARVDWRAWPRQGTLARFTRARSAPPMRPTMPPRHAHDLRQHQSPGGNAQTDGAFGPSLRN